MCTQTQGSRGHAANRVRGTSGELVTSTQLSGCRSIPSLTITRRSHRRRDRGRERKPEVLKSAYGAADTANGTSIRLVLVEGGRTDLARAGEAKMTHGAIRAVEPSTCPVIAQRGFQTDSPEVGRARSSLEHSKGSKEQREASSGIDVPPNTGSRCRCAVVRSYTDLLDEDTTRVSRASFGSARLTAYLVLVLTVARSIATSSCRINLAGAGRRDR